MYVRRLAWSIGALMGASALLAQQSSTLVFQPALSPTTANLHAVTVSETSSPFGNELAGLFIAVGDGGAIVTSTDAADWSLLTVPSSPNLYGVAANFEPVYVAVGDAGVILTSIDGANWPKQESETAANLRAVASDGSNFMAVGQGGTICFSNNGFHWVSANSGVHANLNAVIYANPLWVIVGDGGTLLTSSDGITFNSLTSGTTQNLTAITCVPTAVIGDPFWFGGVGQQASLPVEYAGSGGALGTYDGTNSPQLISGGDGDYTGAAPMANVFSESGFVTAQGQIQGGQAPLQLPAGVKPNAICGDGQWVVVCDGGAIWTNGIAYNGPGDVAGYPAAYTAFSGQSLTLQAPANAGASYQWWFQSQPIAGAMGATLTLPTLSAASNGIYSVTVASPTLVGEFSDQLNVEAIASYSPGLVSTAGTPLSIAAANNAPIYWPLQFSIQADGKWLLEWPYEYIDPNTGEFDTTTDFMRLNTDGSIDNSFYGPEGTVPANSVLAPLPNGDMVMASADGLLSWRRLNSYGFVDGTLPTQYADLTGPGALTGSLQATTDPAGGVYLAMTVQDASAYNIEFCRLNSVQVQDLTFGSPWIAGTAIVSIQGTSAGLLHAVQDQNGGIAVGRFTPAGQPDPSFANHEFPANTLVAFTPDGATIALVPAPSLYSATAYAFVGLNADGTQNENVGGFVAGDPWSTETSNSLFSDGSTFTPFSSLSAIGGGQFFVIGSFQSLNLTPAQSGMAVVQPDTNFAASRLVNLSVRGQVNAQAPLNVSGYIGGTGTLSALLRGIGPTLANFGVSNPLPDPEIQLYEGQTPVASNDNWWTNSVSGIAQTEAIVGAFQLPANSLDAALTYPLAGGPFSLLVTGKGGSGITLGEMYDANAQPTDASQPRMTNVSVLAQTSPGSEQLTAGFVVAGPDARQLLIRAVGPGLAPFGVTGVPDPTLTLYSGTNVIASNTGWGTNSNPDQVTAAETEVGAFALTLGSADSVLLVIVPPGSYTAAAGTASGDSGTVLLEVYEVP